MRYLYDCLTATIYNREVATIHSAPGFKCFEAFCTKCEVVDDEAEPMCFDTQVADNEAGDSVPNDLGIILRENTATTDFCLDGPESLEAPLPNSVEDKENTMPPNVLAESLKSHHQLGHISPKRIQLMAKFGILPSCLATCPIPLCTCSSIN
jgi:hypothetical protein